MKNVRKAISKKIRFEVFKRDSFTCQYCGRASPDAVLEIDHIHPVAKSGSNEILNLVTSCKDCNSGKSDRTLDDNTVLKKQHRQMAVMQDKLEQQKLQLKWKKRLMSVNDAAVDELEEYWYELTLTGELRLTNNARSTLKKLVRKYGPEEVIEAMQLSSEQYLYFSINDDGVESVVRDSWEEAWRKISGICYCRRLDEKTPGSGRLPYILGILRNRLSYVNEHAARELLQLASQTVDVAELENHAKMAWTWSQWGREINQRIDQDEDHLKDLRLEWSCAGAGMIEMPEEFDFEMKSLMKGFCKCSVMESRNIGGLYKAMEFSLEQHASRNQVFVSEDPGLRDGDGNRPTRPSDANSQKAFDDLRNVCIYLGECDSESGFSVVFDSLDPHCVEKLA